jgi:4-hydroxy-tetrahydrodipicolinate synthase
MDFRGNMVALVTPFRNGSLDREAMTGLVDRVLAGGVSAVVPCGTTGESPTLSHDEHDRVVATVIEAANGRKPVVAGTGSNSTAEAVRLTKAAAKLGADAVLSVCPYYNRPTQEGLYRHFTTVADSTELPVILYDIPGRTGVGLTLDTLARLGDHPNIAAIKEATGQTGNATQIRRHTSLAVLSGDDAQTLPMMALGARGVISVLSNLLPSAMTGLVEAAEEDRFSDALKIHDRLQPLFQALFLESNPIPIKAALSRVGWIDPEIRPPLFTMTRPNEIALEEALEPYLEELAAFAEG